MSAVGVITLLDASKREDLTDVVYNISPTETPLLSGFPEGPKATAVLHEFLTDTFAAAADNATYEATAFSVTDTGMPSRSNNLCQTLIKHIQVSRTQQLINSGVPNSLEYVIMKRLKEHAKDLELALMCGSRATGSTGSGDRMDGVLASISTYKTLRSSGESINETVFNDIVASVKGGTDEIVNEIYAGTTMKRDISKWTGRSGTYFTIPATDRRVVNVTDHYVGDFGTHNIFWHRNLGSGTNGLEIVGLNTNYWALSWLDRTHAARLPLESIDRYRAQIVSQLTLEDRAENANFYMTGFTY